MMSYIIPMKHSKKLFDSLKTENKEYSIIEGAGHNDMYNFDEVNKKIAEFLKWLDKMEYDVFKIPRPDITLYLSLPLKFVEVLIKERNKNGTNGRQNKRLFWR